MDITEKFKKLIDEELQKRKWSHKAFMTILGEHGDSVHEFLDDYDKRKARNIMLKIFKHLDIFHKLYDDKYIHISEMEIIKKQLDDVTKEYLRLKEENRKIWRLLNAKEGLHPENPQLKILTSKIKKLITIVEKNEINEQNQKIKENEEDNITHLMNQPIDILEFSLTTRKVLSSQNITTVKELLSYSESCFLKMPMMGIRSRLEIKRILSERGLSLNHGYKNENENENENEDDESWS